MEVGKYILYDGKLVDWRHKDLLLLYNLMMLDSKNLRVAYLKNYTIDYPRNQDILTDIFDNAPYYPVQNVNRKNSKDDPSFGSHLPFESNIQYIIIPDVTYSRTSLCTMLVTELNKFNFGEIDVIRDGIIHTRHMQSNYREHPHFGKCTIEYVKENFKYYTWAIIDNFVVKEDYPHHHNIYVDFYGKYSDEYCFDIKNSLKKYKYVQAVAKYSMIVNNPARLLMDDTTYNHVVELGGHQDLSTFANDVENYDSEYIPSCSFCDKYIIIYGFVVQIQYDAIDANYKLYHKQPKHLICAYCYSNREDALKDFCRDNDIRYCTTYYINKQNDVAVYIPVCDLNIYAINNYIPYITMHTLPTQIFSVETMPYDKFSSCRNKINIDTLKLYVHLHDELPVNYIKYKNYTLMYTDDWILTDNAFMLDMIEYIPKKTVIYIAAI